MNRSARIAAAGVLLIFGGELACLIGASHAACHIAFYAGVAAVLIGAVMHYRSDRTRAPREHPEQ